MNSFITDPNNLVSVAYANEEYDMYNDDQYDEILGRIIKNRAKRRANNPKVVERLVKKDLKRMRLGKEPKRPDLVDKYLQSGGQNVKKTRRAKKQAIDEHEVGDKTTGGVRFNSRPVSMDKTAPKGSVANPINSKDLKVHKKINDAKQNELITMQEELRTEGLKKRVEQEDLKSEKLKQQAGMFGAGKNAMYLAIAVGTFVAYKMVSGKASASK